MFFTKNTLKELQLKFFVLFCTLFSITQSIAQTSFTFSQIPISDPDIIAPGRGAEEWMVMNQVNIPIEGVNTQPLDAYYRFEWTQIEKSKGVYDWTVLNAAFKRAIDKGQKFSFGIMPLCSTCSGTLANNAKLTYPTYLHNEMQSEANKDWIYNGVWIPNWNSNNFLLAWENMLKAVSTHINNTTINGVRLSSIVNYIDIRGYGNWGEWHNYPYGNNEPVANKATATSLIRLINAHKNAFPDIRLVGLSDAFDTGNWSDVPAQAGYYLLTGTNNAGQFGWRRDNWGDPASWYRDKLENNGTTYNGQVFKDLIMNKWKYAPIVGEPSSCCTINGGICPYWEMESQMKRYHTLSFGNGNLESPSSSCVRANIRQASKSTGYRLIVTGGNMSTSLTSGVQFSINLNWQNLGITPTYEKWNVVFQLRNANNEITWSGISSFKPQMFLPQTTPTLVQDNFTLPVTVPAGTYSLVMLVTDPNNYRKPLPLAIKGRNADGSYLIRSSITVAQSTTKNKLPTANAGADKTILLPTNSLALDGTASSDSDGVIVKHRWSQVGGPGTASFTDYFAATATVQNLLQGVYSFRLTVTDDKNDSAFDDVTITVQSAPVPALSASISNISHVKCYGEKNGAATVAVTGGTSPYTYSWNTATTQTNSTAVNLGAGTYSVKVTDSKAVTATASVTINQPDILDLIVKADSITVNGGSTTVSLVATGGSSPYSFTGQTSIVKAGTYTYTVIDANGCTKSRTITFSEPPPPVSQVAPAPLTLSIGNIKHPSCFGSNNGSVTVNVSGGVAPYSYSWNSSPVQTNASATVLAAGSYTVVVTDAEKRSGYVNVTLTEPEKLTITAISGIITRYRGSTSVTLSATGGTPPYTFTGPVSNVYAGTYTYVVTDSKGCQSSTTITITEPQAKGKFRKYTQSQPNSSAPPQHIQTILPVENNHLIIYPNPTGNVLTINIDNEIRGKGSVMILNMSGVTMATQIIKKETRLFVSSLDVSNLAKGTYIVKVHVDQAAPIISKFIKL